MTRLAGAFQQRGWGLDLDLRAVAPLVLRCVSALQMNSFKDFLLKPELIRALNDCAFEHPTQVQHESLPHAILGVDLLCQAKSGMGKTAVFVLATLQQLDTFPNNNINNNKNDIKVLVLCPTCELVHQTSQNFLRFSKYFTLNVKTLGVHGWSAFDSEKKVLENPPNILVATPNTLLNLLEDGSANLSNIKHFIVDECDRVLESIADRVAFQKIFVQMPPKKQVLVFSTTLSEGTRALCLSFMVHPFENLVRDPTQLTLHGLMHHFLKIQETQKNLQLVNLLDCLEFNQVIIFAKTSERAATLNKLLHAQSFPSVTSHGDLHPQERVEKYIQFKDFASRIMVATDSTLGRGVDFYRVNIIFNFDMAHNEDTYLHRIGRTGRLGTRGLIISFLSTEEDVRVLEASTKKFGLEIDTLPEKIDPSVYMNQ